MRERRGEARADIAATATIFRQEACAGTYLIENMSASGALLCGPTEVRPGEVLRVLITLPRHRPFVAHASAVRVDQEGENWLVAVNFLGLPEWRRDAIQSVVLKALEKNASVAPQVVLVVDDEPTVQRALVRDLHGLGMIVHATKSADEATRFLEARKVSVVSAIVDMCMPETDGLAFVSYLRAEQPQIRRIMTSGSSRPYELELALSCGLVHDFLSKPWTRDFLARVLEPAEAAAARV